VFPYQIVLTPPGLDLQGIVPIDTIDLLAAAALQLAARPAWGNPLVVALELGFEMLPCSPGTTPEWDSTARRIAFAAEPCPFAHARRVRLGLARGLLLRAGVEHAFADVAILARRLRQIPE
jgi:hypothetical protein